MRRARHETVLRSNQGRDTQLLTIRDLMLAAARRGAWLTLGEIALLTEVGEASVSAQLRHLRKLRHGRHRVEKRVRPARPIMASNDRGRRAASKRPSPAAPTIWEYRVLPPAERAMPVRPDGIGAGVHERDAAAQGPLLEDALFADVAGSAQQDCFSARAAASLRRPDRAIARTRFSARAAASLRRPDRAIARTRVEASDAQAGA